MPCIFKLHVDLQLNSSINYFNSVIGIRYHWGKNVVWPMIECVNTGCIIMHSSYLYLFTIQVNYTLNTKVNTGNYARLIKDQTNQFQTISTIHHHPSILYHLFDEWFLRNDWNFRIYKNNMVIIPLKI